MTSLWIAALIAIFVWWFSTGAIMWAVKRIDTDPNANAHSTVGWGVLVLLLGILGLMSSLQNPSVAGVYIAFLSALVIWGWIELSFLTGVITGPNPRECPPNTSGWDRFTRAWGAIAYHEVLIATCLVCIILVSRGAENTFGMWVFAILFFARISAKLNLFFGVPKINIEMLPKALAHLPSHFRYAKLNAVFPFSVTALSFATACWMERVYSAESAADAVGFTLLAALTSLALLEHWLMVLPLPDEKLWRWAMPVPKSIKKTGLREDPNGL
jgi:putative photosynthetic complex assembly protein 2